MIPQTLFLRQSAKRIHSHLYQSTADEQAAIKQEGKIPDVAKFAGRAALDDLMTESALQSFITDQAAFDERIRQIAAKL